MKDAMEERFRYYQEEAWLPPLLTLRWKDLDSEQQEEAIAEARLHARKRVGALIHEEGERENYEPPQFLPRSLPEETGAEDEMMSADAEYWERHGHKDPRWVAFLAEWSERVQEAADAERLG